MARKQKTKSVAKTDYTAPDPTLSPELQDALIQFFRCYPPKYFSRGLRNALIELMTHQEEGHRDYVFKTLLAMEMFFDILDLAEDSGFNNVAL